MQNRRHWECRDADNKHEHRQADFELLFVEFSSMNPKDIGKPDVNLHAVFRLPVEDTSLQVYHSSVTAELHNIECPQGDRSDL